VLRLAQDVQENREEIKEVRRELRDTVEIVQRLRVEMEQVGERERRERQILALQLENLLLRKREVLALMEGEEGG
jgi:hypothetical protein